MIKQEIDDLFEQILKIKSKISELQHKCSHDGLVWHYEKEVRYMYILDSYTTNYCRWAHCEICRKTFDEELTEKEFTEQKNGK